MSSLQLPSTPSARGCTRCSRRHQCERVRWDLENEFRIPSGYRSRRPSGKSRAVLRGVITYHPGLRSRGWGWVCTGLVVFQRRLPKHAYSNAMACATNENGFHHYNGRVFQSKRPISQTRAFQNGQSEAESGGTAEVACPDAGLAVSGFTPWFPLF